MQHSRSLGSRAGVVADGECDLAEHRPRYSEEHLNNPSMGYRLKREFLKLRSHACFYCFTIGPKLVL